ncbi:hypothetical protein [Bacillus kwashiorkori]|uniref:hypothetical protein n=1 Tax=Bacillus kwashiorkori TaxID=1522318 RepID=UPI00078116D4|nr:hypothetical protein [Bacillus kwashiorkori]
MEKFHLPDDYLDANWGLKHKLVKGFITNFKDKKKDILKFKQRISWNTPLILELLDILNLVPVDKNFKYNNWQAPFNVRCIIHNHSFNTCLETINKGQICSFCLVTVRGLSQFDAEKKARDLGYKLLDNYKGYHKKHLIECPKGHKIHMYYSSIFQGCCEICGDERKRNKLRFPYDKVVTLFSQLKYLYPSIKLLTTRTEYENYKGKSDSFKIRYTCVYCGKEKKGKLQDIKAHHLMHKHCSSEFINIDRRLTYQEVVNRFKIKGLLLITTEGKFNLEYKNNSYRIENKCENCRIYSGFKPVRDILTSGCPVCNLNYYNKPNNILQQWSDKIKINQNYTCFNCGYSGSGLEMHAHHLYAKKHFPLYANELWCGMVLCAYCHIHNTYAYHKYEKMLEVKSTPGIFIDWINNWGEGCEKESYRIHSQKNSKKSSCPKNNLKFFNAHPFNLFKEDLYLLN